MIGTQSTLVLMGLRGSGKSTLGRRLARETGAAFADLDERTCALLGGGKLADLWAEHGETEFRRAEAVALETSIAEAADRLAIIALGGGTPTAPNAEPLLVAAADAGHIFLVYLRASPRTLRARLESTDTSTRPSLTGGGTLAEIEGVHAARDPLYRRIATHVIEIDGCDEDAVTAELAAILTAPRRPGEPRDRTR